MIIEADEIGIKALRDACDVLDYEANRLASWYDKNRDCFSPESASSNPQFPDRVLLAVQREMQRLRGISEMIRPPKEIKPEE